MADVSNMYKYAKKLLVAADNCFENPSTLTGIKWCIVWFQYTLTCFNFVRKGGTHVECQYVLDKVNREYVLEKLNQTQ